MAYKTGKSKPLEEISLSDVLRNSIWEWALDEEGVEGQDETWQRPIVGTDNVIPEMQNPTITLLIKNSNIYGCAEYDHKTETINAISIWEDNEWKVLNDYDISGPITFISIPKINGIEGIEFICQRIEDDTAFKI